MRRSPHRTRPGTRVAFASAVATALTIACHAPPTAFCGADGAGALAQCQPPPRPPPPPAPSCGTDSASGIGRAASDAGSSWPNAPADLARTNDEPFNAMNENGWQLVERQSINGSGVSLESDSSAPLSPPNVLQFTYGEGFPAGYEPGAVFYDLSTPVKESYFGFWWKPSNPWQNNTDSGINKLAFIMTVANATDGEIVIIMFGADTGYTIQVVAVFPGDTRRLSPNVVATPVVLGVWHRIEWYVKYSTIDTTVVSTADSTADTTFHSRQDGVTRWWLDGVLQGEYADVQTPVDAGFKEFQVASTWGGVVGTKQERDFFCYDHAHLSWP